MSGPVALLCSGQGGQHRAMFALTGGEDAAEPVFAAAARHLDGTDPRDFVRHADDDALFTNKAGQILCCTQALAAWAVLGDARPARPILAGYSVGELAAWGLAGLLDADSVLRLAARRAALMDGAAPAGSGLLAVSGLRRDALESILPADVAVAISNAEDGFVVGGPEAALAALAARPGLRTRWLRVAVPSHTAAMRPAAEAFAAVLAERSWPRPVPGARLLGGIDAEPVRDPVAGARRLAEQIAREIRWGECLRACGESGAVAALELGPGTALSRMAEAALPGLPVRALEQFRSVDGLRHWLAQER